jgi:hypothetical protein
MRDENGDPVAKLVLSFTPLVFVHNDAEPWIGDKRPSAFTGQLRNKHARVGDDKH